MLQTPPEGTLLRLLAKPAHTASEPLMADGTGLTV
jgi:hypothetical protein